MLSTSGKDLLYDNSPLMDKLCPNIMIKIPGAEEGLVVIETLLEEGIQKFIEPHRKILKPLGRFPEAG
jgi:hypothetical protein